MSPRVGKYYRVHFKGTWYKGQVQRIARMRSGAVLAFGTWGKKGIPVTTYATWEEV